MRELLTLLLSSNFLLSLLQTQPVYRIRGTVIEGNSRQPLEFINVMVLGLNKGDVTNTEGHFTIEQVFPGIYRLQVTAIGYKSVTTPEYIVSTKDLNISIETEENLTKLTGVTATASPFRRDLGSPVGLRIVGLQEIEKNPGANRDISHTVQSYPGVAFSPIGYHNDSIVHGGSPSENRFYLDGVEIPNINHFSTRGASGGPVGILNTDLIREVNFYTGAFPTDRGNALSSVLDFKLCDRDMEHNSVKATLGASEVSLASNGHIGKKISYLVSIRQSYLQSLFDTPDLPLLSTFTDAQFKLKTRFNEQNELTVLGLGGIDNMRLNTKADSEDNEYILSYLPKTKQETLTLGAVYRHYAGVHVQSVVVSHSYLDNRNTKYRQNDESVPENLMLRLRPTGQETKFCLENNSSFRNWKVSLGLNLDYSQYTNTTFQKAYIDQAQTSDYHTYLGMIRWGLFGTISYSSMDERFIASLGLRANTNNYSSATKSFSDQLSPRISLSCQLTDHWLLSGNARLYYQLSPYAALSFKGNNGTYVNKYSLRYMKVSQESLSISWRKGDTFEVSVEGFYEDYDKIPLSVVDGIPLICKGNDYGVIGNELLTSTAQGRSYGAEILAKWLIAKKLNLASSFTIFKSEYRNDKESEYIVSAWDNRYIFNLRGTYNLPRQWSVGMKVSCIGGAPYMPYDEEKLSLVSTRDAQGKAYYDYSKYNRERLPAFAQVDLRIDKTFYLKHCMLGFYPDLQNITVSRLKQQDVLMSTGVIESPEAPADSQHYKMKRLKQSSGALLPTSGITFGY